MNNDDAAEAPTEPEIKPLSNKPDLSESDTAINSIDDTNVTGSPVPASKSNDEEPPETEEILISDPALVKRQQWRTGFSRDGKFTAFAYVARVNLETVENTLIEKSITYDVRKTNPFNDTLIVLKGQDAINAVKKDLVHKPKSWKDAAEFPAVLNETQAARILPPANLRFSENLINQPWKISYNLDGVLQTRLATTPKNAESLFKFLKSKNLNPIQTISGKERIITLKGSSAKLAIAAGLAPEENKGENYLAYLSPAHLSTKILRAGLRVKWQEAQGTKPNEYNLFTVIKDGIQNLLTLFNNVGLHPKTETTPEGTRLSLEGNDITTARERGIVTQNKFRWEPRYDHTKNIQTVHIDVSQASRWDLKKIDAKLKKQGIDYAFTSSSPTASTALVLSGENITKARKAGYLKGTIVKPKAPEQAKQSPNSLTQKIEFDSNSTAISTIDLTNTPAGKLILLKKLMDEHEIAYTEQNQLLSLDGPNTVKLHKAKLINATLPLPQPSKNNGDFDQIKDLPLRGRTNRNGQLMAYVPLKEINHEQRARLESFIDDNHAALFAGLEREEINFQGKPCLVITGDGISTLYNLGMLTPTIAKPKQDHQHNQSTLPELGL